MIVIKYHEKLKIIKPQSTFMLAYYTITHIYLHQNYDNPG